MNNMEAWRMLVNTASYTETDVHAQYSTEPHGEWFGLQLCSFLHCKIMYLNKNNLTPWNISLYCLWKLCSCSYLCGSLHFVHFCFFILSQSCCHSGGHNIFKTNVKIILRERRESDEARFPKSSICERAWSVLFLDCLYHCRSRTIIATDRSCICYVAAFAIQKKRPEIFAPERSYPFSHVLNVVKGSVITQMYLHSWKLTAFFCCLNLNPSINIITVLNTYIHTYSNNTW